MLLVRQLQVFGILLITHAGLEAQERKYRIKRRDAHFATLFREWYRVI